MKDSALEPLTPVLNMNWTPQVGPGGMFFPESCHTAHMIMNKLAIASKIALCQKANGSSRFTFYYKQGAFSQKRNQNDCYWEGLAAEDLFLSRSKDIQVHSFWGNDDSEVINECDFFTQDMTVITFVLLHFFSFGKQGVEFAWGDLDDELKDMICDISNFIFDEDDDEEEINDWIEECSYIIKGFDFAFSRKAGPLISEIDTFFKDICNGFDYTLTEQNLRRDFSPFLTMFWGNDEISYRTCLNVISSRKIGKYIKIRNRIPDSEKVLIEKAISIFSQPINNESALTEVYFNEDDPTNDNATVVFLTYDDSEGKCSVHLDMIHPLYDCILEATHHDIDELLKKYSPA